MITQERKDELTAAGYVIEDLGAEYGPQFEGMFRWLNSTHPRNWDGYGCECFSEDEAWADADRSFTRDGI